MSVKIICGDITSFDGDVIVNAANPIMLGGGGVDGAIHRAAGGGLRSLCSLVYTDDKGIRCPPGQVRPTPSAKLPCKWVFHTVAPVKDMKRAGEFRPGEDLPEGEDLQVIMASCFYQSIALAKAMGLKSIAFPALGCGIYGWGHEEVAEIAFLAARCHPNMDIYFYLYPADAYPIWVKAAEKAKVSLHLP